MTREQWKAIHEVLLGTLTGWAIGWFVQYIVFRPTERPLDEAWRMALERMGIVALVVGVIWFQLRRVFGKPID